MIEITPADHEAVRAFLRSDDCPLSVKMVLGAKPDALLALLAGHRQRAEGAMKERCAKVAEDWCVSKAARGVVDSMRSSISIATAIRGIDVKGEGGGP